MASKKEEVPMRTVTVRRDKQHTSDLFLSINGETMQIKRGVTVTIPEKFAKLIDNMEKMDDLSLARSEEAAKNF